ncbi:Phosphoribosyl-ATP pyrophosphohydrolase (HisI2) [Fructobacillus tropaeoli]|uniref:Phosphoribosyl-ATP pyrophosphatase n=1 Tax=Fructobacillus tropaeoli TaxID=709323 RepID=A0ABN9YHP9_9LACO|nr:Phosphoribosyl-ATP pyrophosphohydrolase (HisI2) [Fructobacillus tropaeoli]CAK1236758.1 Phosphoribosyl-ATP pyrophosphohydrolase (HisI2) [Fructobacillus tropaeoli]
MEQTIQELYDQVLARKENPVEGSYTAYLYDKGLDKILKKVGEESTELIVGAKNSRAELTYETADLFFHLMVLLVDQGISLADIQAELGSRVGQKSKLHERSDWR